MAIALPECTQDVRVTLTGQGIAGACCPVNTGRILNHSCIRITLVLRSNHLRHPISYIGKSLMATRTQNEERGHLLQNLIFGVCASA